MATLSAKVVGKNVTKYRKAAGLSQSGIERVVRACMEGFPPPTTDDAPEDKDGPALPIGGAADGSQDS